MLMVGLQNAAVDIPTAALDNGHVSKILRSRQKKQSTDEAGSTVSGQKPQTVQKLRMPDRRIRRTHRLLHEALIALIRQRGWDAITVQDVCERADVGRSTFYVHFADKEELLVSGFGELREQLRANVVAEPSKPLAFTRALLDHTREYEPIYRALLGRRTAQVVYRSWIDLVCDLLEEDIAKLAPAGPHRSAAVRYLAGALWELLSWWSEQPTRSSTVDLDETFRRLTMAVLHELIQLPEKEVRPVSKKKP
jgi:AcrR family transcriptional regulator